jgi:23S rRNA pseudouridine2605 synthase
MRDTNSARRVGLARALSKLGYCSRSQAFDLIRAGRVRLNGSLRRDPETPTRIEKDRIEVDEAEVGATKKVYLMLNKPRGVVTTASDEKDRKTVYDCLGQDLSWIAPVGRLDKASEGLLLFTNDSEWAARVLAPETHLDRTYHVQVDRLADHRLAEMVKGVESDGEFLRAKSARMLRRGQRHAWLEVVLDEGKNRQIRRMLTQLGMEVLRLVRVAIGPLPVGGLPKGAFRSLSSREKLALERAMQQPSTSMQPISRELGQNRDRKATWR